MKAKLINKIVEAKGTKSFVFKLDKPLSFLPGQFIYLTLPKLDFTDSRGATRHFTVSISPTESKSTVQITTRIRDESGFKKTLDSLPVGNGVEIEGPSGTFVFDEKTESKNNVLLAGGIGITPFRTFIKYNLDKNLKVPMRLIYSNGDPDFVFKKELEKWNKDNDFIKIDFFDTSKLGHLDKVSFQKLIQDSRFKIQDSTFWVVGPPAFVSAMEETMESLKIPSSNIITEKFTGY